MSGNGNKGMETVRKAWPRVALVRVGVVVGDIFGNDGGKRQGYGRSTEPCNGENRLVINIMI